MSGANTDNSKINMDSPVGLAVEIFEVTTDSSTTSVVITPTVIGAIYMVTVTPKNSASEGKGYLASFHFGDPTATLTVPVSSSYIVKIEGARS